MKFKIKEIYLILIIVLGLTSTAIYTTYALFNTTSEINNVVMLETNSIKLNNNLNEYEMIKVPAGKEALIELNAINNTSNTLYYQAWYEMIKPNTKTEDVDLGLYTEKVNIPASGTITSSTKKTLLVGINNLSNSEILINLGILADKDNYPNLTNGKIELPTNYPTIITVTPDYIKKHTTITEKPVNIIHNYTGSVQTNVLEPGNYKLETWGAQGGNYSSGYGGKGGYSYGTLTINNKITIYSNVGGAGSGKTGGFNGGTSTTNFGAGGGGASDIRIGQNSLHARVIVAGGGGGNGYSSANQGGFGGGTTGGTGTNGSYAGGGGGTQTSGGTSYDSNGQGKFGSGGVTNTAGGGAGGGWYGGGHGKNGGTDSAGGGGSGYVYTSSTASSYPSGGLLNSKYYLTNAATIGNNRTGHGMVKITGNSKLVNVSVPVLEGLTDINISIGTNYNLLGDVNLVCETGTNGCKIIKTNISNTSNLKIGNYKIKYLVSGSNTKKYIFERNLNILEYKYEEILNLKVKDKNSILNQNTRNNVNGIASCEIIYDTNYTGSKQSNVSCQVVNNNTVKLNLSGSDIITSVTKEDKKEPTVKNAASQKSCKNGTIVDNRCYVKVTPLQEDYIDNTWKPSPDCIPVNGSTDRCYSANEFECRKGKWIGTYLRLAPNNACTDSPNKEAAILENDFCHYQQSRPAFGSSCRNGQTKKIGVVVYKAKSVDFTTTYTCSNSLEKLVNNKCYSCNISGYKINSGNKCVKNITENYYVYKVKLRYY